MHVIAHVAWCSFSSFDSFSFVLCPSYFNMFLWHPFAMYSLVILIVLLVAPTPSEAMPVNVSLHIPRSEKCTEGGKSPCICDGAYGLGLRVSPTYCGRAVYNYVSLEHQYLTLVKSSLFALEMISLTSGIIGPK
jgi:hypothetical protein